MKLSIGNLEELLNTDNYNDELLKYNAITVILGYNLDSLLHVKDIIKQKLHNCNMTYKTINNTILNLKNYNYYKETDQIIFYINNINSIGVSNENYIEQSGYNCYTNDDDNVYHGARCIDEHGNPDAKCQYSYKMNTKTDCENKCNTIKGDHPCTGYLYGLPDSPQACAFRSHICISNCVGSSKQYSTWVRKDAMNDCPTPPPTPKPKPTQDICDIYGCEYRTRSHNGKQIPDTRYVCLPNDNWDSGEWVKLIKNSNTKDYPDNFKEWINQGCNTAGGDDSDGEGGMANGGCVGDGISPNDDEWQCGYGKCTYDGGYFLCKNIMAHFCKNNEDCIGFTYWTTDQGTVGAYFYTKNSNLINEDGEGAWIPWPGKSSILAEDIQKHCNVTIRDYDTDNPSGSAGGPEYCQNWCEDIKVWNFADNYSGNPSCYGQDSGRPTDAHPLVHPCIDPSFPPWRAGMRDDQCINDTIQVNDGGFAPCGKGNFLNAYKSHAGGHIVYFPNKINSNID